MLVFRFPANDALLRLPKHLPSLFTAQDSLHWGRMLPIMI